MIYKTKQVKGKGRGKLLGYPTINFEIPQGFNKREGVYAGWVWIEKKRHKGAFHYGPIPTFEENAKSLEVFLIKENTSDFFVSINQLIEIEIIKRIRSIKKFRSLKELSAQIQIDVKKVIAILR